MFVEALAALSSATYTSQSSCITVFIDLFMALNNDRGVGVDLDFTLSKVVQLL